MKEPWYAVRKIGRELAYPGRNDYLCTLNHKDNFYKLVENKKINTIQR